MHQKNRMVVRRPPDFEILNLVELLEVMIIFLPASEQTLAHYHFCFPKKILSTQIIMEKVSDMLLFKVLLLQDVPIISVVITVLSSVLIVTLFAFALLTCYILFIRHQYSHIPSPPLYRSFS